LAGRGERDYPALGSVLVYPGAFIADGGLFVEGGGEVRLGESWQHGTVVLSWDSVRRAAAGHSDGLNVVLHEFAHQLDPAGDNEPRSEVFEQEYGKLRVRARRGRRSLLDSYGADSRSEFFAVATEAFFERPRTMRERHPALYDEMAGFYRLDPAVWQEPPDRALSTGERV